MSTTLPSSERPISIDGPRLPAVILFDVNETLSDMSPMAMRFADVGAPPTWPTTGSPPSYETGLRSLPQAAPHHLPGSASAYCVQAWTACPSPAALTTRTNTSRGGFNEFPVHKNVRYGIPALGVLDTRLVTFSNGAAIVALRLLERARLGEYFERALSVEDAGVWKPAPGAYTYAAQQCNVEPIDMILAAVHPGDIDGANRAGLGTAWINRTGATYPDYFTAPTIEATSVLHPAPLLSQ